MNIEQLHTINTSKQKTPQGAGVSRRLSWLPFPAARFAGQIRGERKNMIVRSISRKIMVCRTCDGSMSIDEDEDGLHLKCTMCARSQAIKLPTIRLRATRPSGAATNPTFSLRETRPSSTANPTFSLRETAMAGAD